MLRIGVDFHAFDGKFQGSRSHLIGLYRAVVARCPDIHFVFFLDKVSELRRLEGFALPNVTCVRMPTRNPLTRLGWQLPLLRWRHRIDVMHTQYIVPLWGMKSTIVTIHDVLFEPYPQFFTPFFVWRSKRLFRWSAKVADVVMTVSEYSRTELATRYGVERKRIGLLLNAVDRQVFHPRDVDADASVMDRRQLAKGQYILSVGRIEPRKDHATLLRAYALQGPQSPPLVIVGQRDFGYGDFERALKELPAWCDVRLLSDVDDTELPILMRHAQIFVYPSLAEGFGMPPLEAMACGAPVITTNTTALPEVVGDAGLTFQPGDHIDLAEKIGLLLSGQGLVADMRKRGLERAAEFSWHNAAASFCDALQSLPHTPEKEGGAG